MTNRIAEMARQIKIEQSKPWDEEAEDEQKHLARLALEDEWIAGIYYKGNSVSWYHSKAERYRKDLQMAWEALQELGVRTDGSTHIADAIRNMKDHARS